MHNIFWTFVRENNEPPEKNSVKTVFSAKKGQKYPWNTDPFAKKPIKLFHASFILNPNFMMPINQEFLRSDTNNVSKLYWL